MPNTNINKVEKSNDKRVAVSRESSGYPNFVKTPNPGNSRQKRYLNVLLSYNGRVLSSRAEKKLDCMRKVYHVFASCHEDQLLQEQISLGQHLEFDFRLYEMYKLSYALFSTTKLVWTSVLTFVPFEVTFIKIYPGVQYLKMVNSGSNVNFRRVVDQLYGYWGAESSQCFYGYSAQNEKKTILPCLLLSSAEQSRLASDQLEISNLPVEANVSGSTVFLSLVNLALKAKTTNLGQLYVFCGYTGTLQISHLGYLGTQINGAINRNCEILLGVFTAPEETIHPVYGNLFPIEPITRLCVVVINKSWCDLTPAGNYQRFKSPYEFLNDIALYEILVCQVINPIPGVQHPDIPELMQGLIRTQLVFQHRQLKLQKND